MTTIKVDMLVIGAGVVGCAVARQCTASFPDKKIVVIEKHQQVGLETSSHNSGMIHSGIHEQSTLLKSRLSVRGNKLAAEFIKEQGIKAEKNGMIIAVPANQSKVNLPGQLFSLVRLMMRGLRLGIPFKVMLSAKKYEPNIHIIAGLFLPTACVVDPLEFTDKLQESAQSSGAKFYFNSRVKQINKENDGYHVTTHNGHVFIADKIINAAGLHADEVAAMAGFTEYKIYPWRGEYYEVVDSGITVTRPVSSVMPRHHGKGLQVLPSVNGKLYIGPNSRQTKRKDDYTTHETGPDVFLQAAQKILPNIKPDKLVWAFAGIRSRLTSSYSETDFVISKDSTSPTFINLIGIESPGLTASLAIAEYVEDLLR